MVETKPTGHRLADRLQSGSLDSPTTSILMRSLLEKIGAMHKAGQLQLVLNAGVLWVSDKQKIALRPASAIVSTGPGNELSILPPELDKVGELSLTADIKSVSQIFSERELVCDPPRIDLFQLGALALDMLTGKSVDDYLMSPKVKTSIPDYWHPWIDQALGFDPQQRAKTCDELLLSLEKNVIKDMTRFDLATPPPGTGLDAFGDTSLNVGEVHLSAEKFGSGELPFTNLGQYRIESRLGSGGMGDVYLGFDPKLQRTVAIKVLPSALARNEDFVARFISEAQAAAQLSHPNIVPIYFIGEDQGHHFFVMEHINGPSLAQELRAQGKLPVEKALQVVQQICSGLADAHGQALIHRDIKPGNILLDRKSGQAKLADFGLVKSPRNDLKVTATGVVMGTVDYIAPEQGRGQPVDGRSDLYSIGVLLYRLLSGRLPFSAESSTGMIFQHAYEPPVALEEVAPSVPKNVVAIVNRLLLKDPDHRYQTAEALVRDLQAVADGGEPVFDTCGEDSTSPSNKWPSAVSSLPPMDSGEAPVLQNSNTMVPMLKQGWMSRMLALFNQQAPESLVDLQNTQQNVDGAIAVYTGRRNELAGLSNDATVMDKELSQRIVELQKLAGEAKGKERAELFAAIKSLAGRRSQQQEQADDIRAQLTKADATLESLKQQRAILVNRLETARKNGPAANERKRFSLVPWGIAATVAAIALAFGLTAWVTENKSGSLDSNDLGISTVVEPERVWGTPPKPGNSINRGDGWIDLVPLIDLKQDVFSGNWRRSGDLLISDEKKVTGTSANKTVLPVLLPNSYELRFRFRTASSTNRLRLPLPVGDGRGALVLGFNGGNGVGFEGIDGSGATSEADNLTSNPEFSLQPNLEHTVLVQVSLSGSQANLKVSVDDIQAIHWTGDQNDVVVSDSADRHPYGDVPMLVVSGQTEFSRLSFRSIKGDARLLRAPFPDTGVATSGNKWSLDFNDSSRLAVADSFRYDGKQPVTMEAWLNPRKQSDTNRVIVIRDEGIYPRLNISISNGFWKCQIFDPWRKRGFDAVSSEPAVWNEWTHVACVYSPGKIVLFVNGEKVATSTKFEPPFINGVQLRIGSKGRGKDAFQGRISQVRISQAVRYQEDFHPKRSLGNDEHVMCLYHFDEGVGNFARDLSGNGHHAKIRLPQWRSIDAEEARAESLGQPGKRFALNFNNDSRYVINQTLQYDVSHRVTVEAWLKPRKSTSTNRVWGILDENEEASFFLLNSKGRWVEKNWNDKTKNLAAVVTSPAPISWNKWTHLAVELGPEKLKLFVDGELVAESLQSKFTPFKMARLRIGSLSDQKDAFQGEIEQFRITEGTRYETAFEPAQSFGSDQRVMCLYHFDEGTGDFTKDTSGNGHHGKILAAQWRPLVP